MDQFLEKIKSIVSLYLENDDFVVKKVIETETELRYIIVSIIDNINSLTDPIGKSSAVTFVSSLEETLEEFLLIENIKKKVTIETEVVYGNKR